MKQKILESVNRPGGNGEKGNAFNIPVNIVAIAILSRGKCGLSTCTTRYLVAMAAADLTAVVTALFTRAKYYFPGSFLETYPLCSIIFVLQCASRDCSVWLTVTFTFDRFVAICCQKLKAGYCTGRTAALVLATTSTLMCLKNIPFYFIHNPREIINGVLWFCKLNPAYYIEYQWVSFDQFDKSLTPLIPFALILVLNTLTVRHILAASRVRKGLRGQRKGENCSDPEMESRRRSAILLFTISGSFIILWLATVVNFFKYNVGGTDPNSYADSEFILEELGYMLQNLSLCTNTFIYGVTQSKFREQFIAAVKWPVITIVRFIRRHNT
ncbi:probable G-protein coupled receptor 139 [Hypanus sabinus]|uniref:probable G-protein coupled receptor 139 n=1 Tax=Hypanus sabinus TaxID=79690 RepID=UPI0028C38B01|nr:probable G-protein coupled receptor 139 [Hypanus sabinus]